MNDVLEKKLTDRFEFFHKRFPFECGDGWFDLVYKLSEDIESQLNRDPKVASQFYVLQVKEKFGGLRFYTGPSNKLIDQLVSEAEDRSFTVCEFCGDPGTPRGGSWVQTLCGPCEERINNEGTIRV